MCGIAGFAGGFWPGLTRRMNMAQKHRGPDGDGVFEDPEAGVGLAHVRLAILDLSSAAAQPMLSPDGRFALVYNGEIYNFRKLRSALEGAWEFRSSGDTEVLLAGLALRGPSFVNELNGIFSIALWDRLEQCLLLARDPLGVKPLYWTEPKPGILVFASEIKAILQHPDVCAEPDFLAIHEHLARGHSSGARTAFKGIRRLPAGTMLSWACANKQPAETKYNLFKFAPSRAAYDECVEELRAAVEASVRNQMISDVPVGVMLSGGIDSSAIALLAKNASPVPLQCFTISYQQSENRLDRFVEDLPYARMVAEQAGLPLINIEIKPDVAALLPLLARQMDEPIADPAIITSYLISSLARDRGVPVLLSGQGTDELFGGYPRYPAMWATRFLEHFPREARRMIAGAAQRMPSGFEGTLGATIRRIRRVLAAAGLDSDSRFMEYASAQSDDAVRDLFSPEIRGLIGQRPSAEQSLLIMAESGIEGFNRYIQRDLTDYLPNHNLLYTDKASMAVGVEVRVPLIDLDIVRIAETYPFHYRCYGRTTKRIFRDAMRGIVPEYILRRAKAGFGAPYRKWLRYDLQDMWFDLAHDNSTRQRGWFDPAALSAIRKRSDSGREDLYLLQWAVMTTELWARAFAVG